MLAAPSHVPTRPSISGAGKSKMQPPGITVQCNAICDIISVLASAQPALVSSLLLSRVIRLINQPQSLSRASVKGIGTASIASASSSTSAADTGTASCAMMHPDSWQEVVALFRPLLYLPFQNATFLAARLPDLLHMIVLLVTQGPINLRTGVHTLSCSIMHSLMAIMTANPYALSSAIAVAATESSNGDIQLRALSFAFELLSSSHFHFMFYEAQHITINNLEMLVNGLAEIVLSTKSVICEKWRRRWWQITLATAMETLPSPTAARCFLTLSILTRTVDLDSSFWRKLYSALQTTLTYAAGSLPSAATMVPMPMHVHGIESQLTTHLLRCFAKLCPHMALDQIKFLIWTAIVLLLQTANVAFPEAARFLCALIGELISGRGVIAVEEELLEYRRSVPALHEAVSRVEAECMGLSFNSRENFSYGLTHTVMAAFMLPACKDNVMDMLLLLARYVIYAMPC